MGRRSVVAVVDAYKVKRECVSDPVNDKRVLIKKEFSASLAETLDVADLSLQKSEITENLYVLRSIVQRFLVAIDCFLVISIGSVDDAINMPSDVALHVLVQRL